MDGENNWTSEIWEKEQFRHPKMMPEKFKHMAEVKYVRSILNYKLQILNLQLRFEKFRKCRKGICQEIWICFITCCKKF
jgi:hypothetical protein